ncbi:MAG TPA: YbhB/YbcL family Raf kinase inhibitor-like protein [Caulobacteraceae bacterium]
MGSSERRTALAGWIAAAFLTLPAALGLAGCGGRGEAPRNLVVDRVEAQRTAPLNPSSMSLAVGGAFAARQSAYADNLSPALTWAATPGAQTYAVIIEDPDARGATTFTHWLIWNIPGEAVGLPEGVPQGQSPPAPAGALQGLTDANTYGYFGPHPPPGTGLHHYHIELFALDAPLPLKATNRLPALEHALQGHVLAKGDLVATYVGPR